MSKFHRFIASAMLCLAATATWAQDRVVYHIDNTAVQGLKGLRNVRIAKLQAQDSACITP